jgi:GAF domain-containing protein/ActR/RegA family two-component response regulator
MGHEVQETAERVAAQVGHSVAGVHERLAVLARLPAVRAGNRQEIERLFQKLLADAPHLENLGLVAPDGTIMVSAVPLPPGRPVSLGDREWLQRVVRWGEPAVGGFQVGRITGNPDAILAHPVLDEQGRLTAVIYAALDLVYASRAVTGAYPGVPLLWAIVDEQGLVLLHSRPETTSGIPLGPLPGMLRGETVVPGTRWHSVVGMPQDLVTARVRATFLRIGLPTGLILLISAAVGLWIAYSTWRPIRDLTSAVRRVGTGESTVQIPVRAGGELGELATTLAETLAAVDRRRGELAALLEAGRAIASSLDLQQSLQAIVQQATIISGTKAVRLLLLDADGKVLRCRVGVGLPMEEERDLVIPVGESFSGQVVATGKPLAVADTRGDPRLRYPQHPTRHGLVSYLGLPVKLGDRVLGVLVFNTQSPRTYSKTEIAYLSAFADHAAVVIENARLFQEERAGRRQLEAVRAVSTEIARELDLDAVLGLIIRRATELTGTGTGTVYLWDEEAQALLPRAWHGHGEWIRGLSFRLGEGVVGTAAQRREGMIVNDYRTSPYGVPLTLEHSRITAVLAEPLLYRDRLLGVIGLDNESTQRPFTQEDRDILTLFAGQAAIAIENARLYDRARRAAREARSLYEVVHSLTTLLDPREVLHLISVKTAELLGTPHAQVVLWDEETKTLRFGAAYGTEAEKVKPQVFHLGEGVNGIVAETRKPLLVNDYQRFPKRRPDMTDLVAVIGVPLLYRGRLLGVLTSHATQAGTIFTEDHLALLTSFADEAAIAIENARLHEAAVRRGEELQAMLRAARTVMSGLDLRGTLDRIIREAAQISGIPHVKVVLVDKEAGAVQVAAAVGRPAEMFEGFAVPLGTGTSGLVAATGEPLFIADCQNDPRNYLYADQDRKLGIHTYLGLPIKIRDEVLGVLTFNTTEPHQYSPAELMYLASFADQAAIAIENARLFTAADTRASELDTLREIGQAVTARLDLPAVLEAVVAGTRRLLDAQHSEISLWDEEGQTLRFGAAQGTEVARVRTRTYELGRGVNGTVALTRKPLVVDDYQASPYALPEFPDVIATITVPVLFGDRLLGVLHSHTTQRDKRFTTDDLRPLQMLASQAAIAIENARLYGEIQEHAATLEARVKERTAELEEALRVKVEFLGKMSHELRTPLNFILGFSDLLQQGTGGPLTPKQATYLDRIQGGGRRLLSLVSEVLDIAQLDAGKSRLRLEPVILAPLVQEILGLVQIPGSQKRLKATTALDPWMPFIVADRFKLAQILHSLVGNAVKFTPEGGSIRIITRQAPGAGNGGPDGGGQPLPSADSVELIVEDTGIGIRPENLETVFEAFYQVDGSDTRAQGGAGLGLALVRKLVELHGGWVWAESAGPGQGSRFVVRLPRLEVPKAKRILLVEDEALIRIPMASALESAGFAVEGAATGADALAVMEAEAFDLLILDVVLPDMEGWEILRRVREAEEVRTLPVLVVTGLEGLNAERALARGADEFLTKPVSPRVLVDTVVRLLASSAASSAGVGPRSLRTVERPGE